MFHAVSGRVLASRTSPCSHFAASTLVLQHSVTARSRTGLCCCVQRSRPDHAPPKKTFVEHRKIFFIFLRAVYTCMLYWLPTGKAYLLHARVHIPQASKHISQLAATNRERARFTRKWAVSNLRPSTKADPLVHPPFPPFYGLSYAGLPW